MNKSRLACSALTKSYHTSEFTLGPLTVDFSVGVTCLVGANGAGKSTFFRLAAGIEAPTSGSVMLNAEHHDGIGNLGYLPQEPRLPLSASCNDFLHYVAWLQRVPRRERSEAVARTLTSVELGDRQRSTIKSLSGGMRRRVGIAHALVHDPKLILLDEPTVGLDPSQRIGLRKTIRQIALDRIVLVSTHLVEDVRGLADWIIVINRGQIAFDGDIQALERHAKADMPGDTPLERAIANILESKP